MAVIEYVISFFTYLLAKKFLRHSLQNSQNFIYRNNNQRNGLRCKKKEKVWPLRVATFADITYDNRSS